MPNLDLQQTWIIAEAGVNHNGDLDMACALVDASVAAKADCVKFQTFKAEALVSKKAELAAYQARNLGTKVSQYEMLKALELRHEHHIVLKAYCDESGIEFLSTPFDIGSFDYLVSELGLRRIKLGSSELTNGPLLVKAGASQKEIILSTGMGKMDEVALALGAIAYGHYGEKGAPTVADFEAAYKTAIANGDLKNRVSVLQCTTSYPMPYEEANLSVIPQFRDRLGLTIGYSDHSPGISLAPAAVALGARIYEKHVTLDKNLPGPDHKGSLTPDELKAMVGAIRTVELALGNGVKTPQPSEIENMPIARKSLAAAHALTAGSKLGEDDIDILRPGKGISPMRYWEALGKTVSTDLGIGDLIEIEDSDAAF